MFSSLDVFVYLFWAALTLPKILKLISKLKKRWRFYQLYHHSFVIGTISQKLVNQLLVRHPHINFVSYEESRTTRHPRSHYIYSSRGNNSTRPAASLSMSTAYLICARPAALSISSADLILSVGGQGKIFT